MKIPPLKTSLALNAAKDSYSKNFNNNKVNNYNDISSSSDSDNEENAQIALMASHQSEDELDEVSNSFELHSYDELQEAFNELHDEFLKLSKICSKQKKTIVELESKVNSQNKLTSCNKCVEKESKIHELTNEINTLNRSTKNLDKILLNQLPSNNKRGIGYSPNNNSGQNKIVFIKESVSKLPYVNERAVPKFKNSNFYTCPKKNFFFKKKEKSNNLIYKYTCNYCNHHGHTPNNCYVKYCGVPKGKFVWVEKGTNKKGPKSLWYLDSGFSRHMTGDKSKFSFILPKDGFVTYGDNNKGKILGIGRIGKPPHVIIDNVLYVDGLKQNILSMRSTM
ncbi:hypothetical protein Lal_00044284 [Lupinus albus]|nr:hypothetical protein Lal_00044284 [Lupinus albus]